MVGQVKTSNCNLTGNKGHGPRREVWRRQPQHGRSEAIRSALLLSFANGLANNIITKAIYWFLCIGWWIVHDPGLAASNRVPGMQHFRQLLECQICHVLVGHFGQVTNLSGPGNVWLSLLWSVQTYPLCTVSGVLCQGLGHSARAIIPWSLM